MFNLMPKRWDVFCSVVDNFGDIGVCWRLARQLANEWHFHVSLWVDDLSSFQKICPEIETHLDNQNAFGVDVHRWSTGSFLSVQQHLADVTIETFSCGLPNEYLRLMAACNRKVAWFNLEYLSAESWIDDCHLRDSPHPNFALKQKFFFPGFSSLSGGVLRENYLLEQRKSWQGDVSKQNIFWQKYGLPARIDNERRISVFCYQQAPLVSLFSAWADADNDVYVIMPESIVNPEILRLFDAQSIGHNVLKRRSLKLKLMPFLTQFEYDHLLWSCDFNVVRGEDSFVRAQLAARPFLWNIYPQQEDIHIKKLNAFLALYLPYMPENCAKAMYDLHQEFNLGHKINKNLASFVINNLTLLHKSAQNWSKTIISQSDLTSQLVQAAKSWLQ